MSTFNQTYNKYKNLYTIYEGTVKSLVPLVQRVLLTSIYKKKYDQLTDSEKAQLQQDINSWLSDQKQRIESITANKQYQSWLYDMFARMEQGLYEDFDDVKNTIRDFEQIIKSPKITKDQRNIQNYKSFRDLHKFVYDFKNVNQQYNNVTFPLVYSNNTYNIYKIGKEQKDQFQQMYGPDGYKTAWCVASSENNYFEYYLEDNDDCYYLWLLKNNKPFGLLHFNSDQFRDVHDHSINDTSFQVLDGIQNLQKVSNYDINQNVVVSDYMFMYRTALMKLIFKQKNTPYVENDQFAIYKDIWNFVHNSNNDFIIYNKPNNYIVVGISIDNDIDLRTFEDDEDYKLGKQLLNQLIHNDILDLLINKINSKHITKELIISELTTLKKEFGVF